MDEPMLSEDFEKPTQSNGRFDNPKSFETWRRNGITDLLKWRLFDKDNSNIPTDEKVLDKTIPVHTITSFESKTSSNFFATWLGHSTVLVHMEGANFITDPIWSKRASFLSWLGPKRFRPPPMEIENLPKMDFGVISHDHYDHLDLEAVQRINNLNPSMRWFVPLNMKSWMQSVGIENTDEFPNRVIELNWGENSIFSINGKEFNVWCVPAQHWGKRSAFDTNQRLWSGWCACGPSKRFYYSGDTGFCEKEFKKIGDKLGPFDLAAIPIGAYEPRWFMKPQHINPEDAVSIHELVKSKFSIGVHWGTYDMATFEHYLEPKEKLAELMKEKPNAKPFVTIEMGTIWQETPDLENSTKTK